MTVISREQQIINLYNSGLSYGKIRKMLGANSNEISFTLKRNNVKMRGQPAHLQARNSGASTQAAKPASQQAAIQQTHTNGFQLLHLMVQAKSITLEDITNFIGQQNQTQPTTATKSQTLTKKQILTQDRYHRIRTYKRDSGLSDEKVARHFDVSVGTVRKAHGKK